MTSKEMMLAEDLKAADDRILELSQKCKALEEENAKLKKYLEVLEILKPIINEYLDLDLIGDLEKKEIVIGWLKN